MTRSVPRRWRRSLLTWLTGVLVSLAPTAANLLPPSGAVRVTPPVGAAVWLADPRELPDPTRAEPAEIRTFLATLDAEEQRGLAAAYPGVVGNLDGAPPSLRYEANRRAMALAGPPYLDRAGQYLLFDPRGQGQVAQVFGDLDHADRIAVLVPGAGNRAGNFWRGVGGKPVRSPSTQGQDLYQSAHGYRVPAERFAVVVWLGYDAPDGVDLSAAREDLAETGAAALERFVTGLTLLRPHATIALLGYSYGSTVIGLAAHRLPVQVTDIAAFGSPGMGVDRATDLGTEARVWAALSPRDNMRWVPGARLRGLGHGTQPAAPGFGASIFPADDVPDHDHYLAVGTRSQASLTAIALLGTDTRETP
ncbi:alpha/beta hydrolase [Micromonospora sp. NPDC005710]|uniref:alpha/beta hydrolase n=1 Tax=Micromonospora sp. NPDC005710 TaxID=3157051 RepID=UPI0033FB7484